MSRWREAEKKEKQEQIPNHSEPNVEEVSRLEFGKKKRIILPSDFDSLQPLIQKAVEKDDPLGLNLTEYQKTQLRRLDQWTWGKGAHYRAPLSVFYTFLRKLYGRDEK